MSMYVSGKDCGSWWASLAVWVTFSVAIVYKRFRAMQTSATRKKSLRAIAVRYNTDAAENDNAIYGSV